MSGMRVWMERPGEGVRGGCGVGVGGGCEWGGWCGSGRRM